MSEYKTILGRVAFDPKDGEAGGKQILRFRIQPTGLGNVPPVDVTLWEPKNTTLKQGDYIVLNGKYETREGQNSDGDPIVYHNVSTNEDAILVLSGAASPAPAAAKKPAARKPKATTEDDF